MRFCAQDANALRSTKLLISALAGHVGSSTNFSGYPTHQELAAA
jgi:hypothetical protein